LEDSWTLPDATPVLASSHSLASDLDNTAITPVEETTICASEEIKTKAVLI
jgi:hypothetical protein